MLAPDRGAVRAGRPVVDANTKRHRAHVPVLVAPPARLGGAARPSEPTAWSPSGDREGLYVECGAGLWTSGGGTDASSGGSGSAGPPSAGGDQPGAGEVQGAGEAERPAVESALSPGTTAYRLGVFIDYTYVYRAARRCFALADPAPPPAFGNVAPPSLAAALTREPPPWIRRSQRRLAHVGVVLPGIDASGDSPMARRVAEWRETSPDIELHAVGSIPGADRRTARAVLLATMAIRAIERGVCDMVVLVTDDAGLLPLVHALQAERRDRSRVELMGWVSAEGELQSPLAAAAPGAWCHRLGPKAFDQLRERPPKPGSARRQRRAAETEEGQTAMAAAFEAAQRAQAPQSVVPSPGVEETGAQNRPASPDSSRPAARHWWQRGRRDPSNC